MPPNRRRSRQLARLPGVALLVAAATLTVLSGAVTAAVAATSDAPAAPASASAPNGPAPAVDGVAANLASNRLDQVLARGVLRIGTTGDYKPFSVRVGHSDTFVGLDIDLAADLARSLGVTLEIVPTTWGTMMGDLATDRFDLGIGGVSVTLERQKRAMFSVPYLRDGKTPIARCADVARFQTLAQLNQPGVRMVVNPGGTNERFARANAPRAALAVWPDNLTIFDRIVSGEADVMVTDAVEARLQQRLHPQLCAIHPEAPFDFSEKALLLPRDAVFKAYVDQWLHQVVESGSFKRAHERWLDYPWGLETLRQAIEDRLQLAPDVARWKWNRNAEIEDLPRERVVIEAMAAQAAALGVPREDAEAFFKAQVEASKTVQRELFMGWQVLHTGPFAQVPDLQAVTRPKLDAVSSSMARALAANWTVLNDPDRRGEVARALHPIEAEALSMKAVAQATAPLLAPRPAGHDAAAPVPMAAKAPSKAAISTPVPTPVPATTVASEPAAAKPAAPSMWHAVRD